MSKCPECGGQTQWMGMYFVCSDKRCQKIQKLEQEIWHLKEIIRIDAETRLKLSKCTKQFNGVESEAKP